MEQEARLQEQVISGPPKEVKERAASQDYKAVCRHATEKEAFWEVEGFTRRTPQSEASLARRHVGLTIRKSVLAALGERESEAARTFVVLRKDFEIDQNLIRHVHLEHGPVATLAEVTLVDERPKTRSGVARRLLQAQVLGQNPSGASTLRA